MHTDKKEVEQKILVDRFDQAQIKENDYTFQELIEMEPSQDQIIKMKHKVAPKSKIIKGDDLKIGAMQNLKKPVVISDIRLNTGLIKSNMAEPILRQNSINNQQKRNQKNNEEESLPISMQAGNSPELKPTTNKITKTTNSNSDHPQSIVYQTMDLGSPSKRPADRLAQQVGEMSQTGRRPIIVGKEGGQSNDQTTTFSYKTRTQNMKNLSVWTQEH